MRDHTTSATPSATTSATTSARTRTSRSVTTALLAVAVNYDHAAGIITTIIITSTTTLVISAYALCCTHAHSILLPHDIRHHHPHAGLEREKPRREVKSRPRAIARAPRGAFLSKVRQVRT